MAEGSSSFTPPKLPVLRWLVDPGRDVPEKIRALLLGELFAAPATVMAALINGLLLNSVALRMHQGSVFLMFMLLDVALVAIRIPLIHRLLRAAAAGRPAATDTYLILALAWCGLQGAMTCAAMATGIAALQVLSVATVLGMVGPICARAYSAPRYAILLICLGDFPLLGGAIASRELWLLVLVAQTPLLLFGALVTIKRFKTLSVAALLARDASHDRAQHDHLTGLLNRFGLTDGLAAQHDFAGRRFALLYLDLDGFKAVNDTFGHEAGDAVLRGVAERLRSVTRVGDMVVRLGGDEFVIVSPDMGPAEAERFSDSMIRRIADRPFPIGLAEPARIGVSIGFACAPEDGTVMDVLHRKADAALYDAKRSGKGVHRRFAEAEQAREFEDECPLVANVKGRSQ
jgi:diguanylate cyclase (GGDEF)-like protein